MADTNLYGAYIPQRTPIEGQYTPTFQPLTPEEKSIIPQTITGQVLTPQPDYSKQVSYPQVPPAPAIPPVQQIEMTKPETEAQTQSEIIQRLTGELSGEGLYRSQQETGQNIPEYAKTVTDLSSQLKAIQNEAAAIPMQLQNEATGRGITTGGLQPLQTAALRNNAIKALSVNSLLEAARGNLSTAQDMVDRAVKAKYEPLKAEIDARRANYDMILNSPEATVAEKNRAVQQKAAEDAREKALAKTEENDKATFTIATTAAKYGADTMTLNRIQSARTPQEALSIAGAYLQDPKAQYELEEMKLNNVLKNEQILTERKERGQIGIPTAKEREEARKEAEAAKGTIPALQDKIALIDSLITHPGFNSAVGPIPSTRIAIADIGGAKQDFIAGVQLLVSKETIDSLLALKAKGGTLGALSDQERILLQSSATRIGSWADEKNGRVVGYIASEASFKKELENIKRLAERALSNAQEGVLDSSENTALSKFFSSPNTSTAIFAPENYFK